MIILKFISFPAGYWGNLPACKAVIYDISLIARNDFMIQLRAIKILTETNRKTDPSWSKTLHHPKDPSNNMCPHQVIVGPDHQSLKAKFYEVIDLE